MKEEKEEEEEGGDSWRGEKAGGYVAQVIGAAPAVGQSVLNKRKLEIFFSKIQTTLSLNFERVCRV